MDPLEGHAQLVQEISDRLEDKDRLAVYVFADKLCELRPLSAVGNKYRSSDSIRSALMALDGRGINAKCAKAFDDRDRTRLLRSLTRSEILAAKLYDSLATDDVDERKRGILIVSDGVDDPDKKYLQAANEDAAKGNSEILRMEFELGTEKYLEAVATLSALKKHRRDGVARYFDIAVLWSWSDKKNSEVFRSQHHVSKEHVLRFWRDILGKPDASQFISQTLVPVIRDKGGNLKIEDTVRTVEQNILAELRVPRSIKVFARCQRYCQSLKFAGDQLVGPTLGIAFSSTYEPEVVPRNGGLEVRGLSQKSGDGIRLLALRETIPPIGGPGSVSKWVPVQVPRWHEDRKNVTLTHFAFLGVYAPMGDRITAEPSGRKYSVTLPQLVNLDTSAVRYTRVPQDRVVFTAAPRVRMRFQIPSDLNDKRLINAVAEPYGDANKMAVLEPEPFWPSSASGEKQDGGVVLGRHSLVQVDFPFAATAKAAVFTPKLVPIMGGDWLSERGTSTGTPPPPVIGILVKEWGLVVAVVIYFLLSILRGWNVFGKSAGGRSSGFVGAGFFLIAETVGVLFYLIGINIDLLKITGEPSWIQREAFRVAYGGSLMPWILVFPGMGILSSLVPVACKFTILKDGKTDPSPSGGDPQSSATTRQSQFVMGPTVFHAFIAWLGHMLGVVLGVVLGIAGVGLLLLLVISKRVPKDVRHSLDNLLPRVQILVNVLTVLLLFRMLLDVQRF